jgi:hypothetical protein
MNNENSIISALLSILNNSDHYSVIRNDSNQLGIVFNFNRISRRLLNDLSTNLTRFNNDVFFNNQIASISLAWVFEDHEYIRMDDLKISDLLVLINNLNILLYSKDKDKIMDATKAIISKVDESEFYNDKKSLFLIKISKPRDLKHLFFYFYFDKSNNYTMNEFEKDINNEILNPTHDIDKTFNINNSTKKRKNIKESDQELNQEIEELEALNSYEQNSQIINKTLPLLDGNKKVINQLKWL